MLLGGDEIGRTQRGNNNAYCQDNEISWFDWSAVDQDLLEWTRRVAALRREHPVFRRRRWFQGRRIRNIEDLAWFRPDGELMTDDDWENGYARAVGVFFNGQAIATVDAYGGRIVDDDFFVLFNASDAAIDWTIPDNQFGREWLVELDTNLAARAGRRRSPPGDVIKLVERSTLVLRAAGRAQMTATSQLQALREHATALGIETSYRDVSGQHHETPEHTLRQLVRRAGGRPRHGAAPARTGHRVRRRRRPVDRRRDARARWRCCSPTAPSSLLPVDRGRVSRSRPTSPVGCHRAGGVRDGGAEEATLVVPPATMPRADRFAGKAGLFVPAYALWERSSPLPSFTHLAALGVGGSRPSASTCWRPCRCTPPSSTSRSTPARTPRPAGCTGTRSTSTTPRCRFCEPTAAAAS